MSGDHLAFRVFGVPVAQGSKRHVGGGVMVESAKALRPWREAVAWEARSAASDGGIEQFAGPVSLEVVFRFPMPASRPAKVRKTGRAWRATAPDLDKLVRAVGDALAASGVIGDDRQIAAIAASKYEVTDWTGARVLLEPLSAIGGAP